MAKYKARMDINQLPDRTRNILKHLESTKEIKFDENTNSIDLFKALLNWYLGTTLNSCPIIHWLTDLELITKEK